MIRTWDSPKHEEFKREINEKITKDLNRQTERIAVAVQKLIQA